MAEWVQAAGETGKLARELFVRVCEHLLDTTTDSALVARLAASSMRTSLTHAQTYIDGMRCVLRNNADLFTAVVRGVLVAEHASMGSAAAATGTTAASAAQARAGIRVLVALAPLFEAGLDPHMAFALHKLAVTALLRPAVRALCRRALSALRTAMCCLVLGAFVCNTCVCVCIAFRSLL